MKKIIKIFILLIICTIAVDVNAAAVGMTNASVRENYSSTATTIQYRGYSERNEALKAVKSYKSTTYTVNFNGQDYSAICIDPGISRPSGAVRCEPAPDDGALSTLRTIAASTDPVTFQLAARFVAIYNGYTYYQDFSDLKYALVSYLQIKGGDAAHEERLRQAMIREGLCSPGSCDQQTVLNNMIWGDTTTIQNAFSLAEQIRGAMGAAGGIVATSGFEYTPSGEGKDVTITVRSKNGVEIPEVRFECSRGCTVTGQSWSGAQGEVSIHLTDNSCAYELKTLYAGSGPYLCKKNEHSQTLLIYVEDGEMADIYQGESGECSDCCTEAPQIEPGYINGTVNNCCDSAHSEAEEYKLDELFCYDDRVKVEYFKKKCNVDYYREEIINDYCELFCTERVTVDTPGSITAVSGRYFELTKTSYGHTYPHIEGFKRCRIRIEWDKWETNYGAQVEKQVEKYNKVQELRANEKMYIEANKTPEPKTESTKGWANCECVYYTPDPTPTNPNHKKRNSYGGYGETATKTFSWTKWDFPITSVDYFKVQIDREKREQYKAYEIIDHEGNAFTARHVPISLYDFDTVKSQADALITQAESICKGNLGACPGSRNTTSSGRGPLSDDDTSYRNEDVPAVLADIQGQIQSNINAYNAAAEQAKILEEELTVCNVYFDEIDPETIFPFNANADFSYSQTYLDDFGELKRDEIFVEKDESGGCVITRNDGGDDIKPPRYSETLYSRYAHDFEDAHDMKSCSMHLRTGEGQFGSCLDENYKASKKFTHDARYQAICDWDDADNTIYTLVPNGSASESTSEINYTQHDRQYRVYLSTLDGTYETFWHVSGLGTNGKFDQYFLDNGTTCAGESAADVSMFTCKLHVEYEIVLTGYCNGVTNGIDNCDPYKEGYDLFNFKVVDPSDLFPAVSDPEDVDYGYNWLVEERGREVLGTIQETGRKDETYAIDNLTYAFELTPTDMQHIKAYNETRIAEGGYSDFELDCKKNCDISVEFGQDIGCERCHSKFLENLAAGKVIYNGTDHEVNGWANSRETLGEVRNGNNW